MSLNEATLIGNLGANPKVTIFENGDRIVEFPIATDNYWNNTKEWHKIKFRGRLGEIAEQYLTKGHQVFIKGKIRYRKYTDKSGNTRWMTEVLGKKLLMVGSKSVKKEMPQCQSQPVVTQSNENALIIESEDISKKNNIAEFDLNDKPIVVKSPITVNDDELIKSVMGFETFDGQERKVDCEPDTSIIDIFNKESQVASMQMEDLPDWLSY